MILKMVLLSELNVVYAKFKSKFVVVCSYQIVSDFFPWEFLNVNFKNVFRGTAEAEL